MKKTIKQLVSLIAVSILLFSIVSASMIIPANENALENAQAPEHSNVIVRTDSGNWSLERVDFIHYANGAVEVKGGSKTTPCYKLLAGKWNTLPVNYVINPTNPYGLSDSFVTSAISTSAETWDAATSKELFNNAYAVNYSAQYGYQDYKNVISFGDYPNNGVIAVTSVWFSSKGATKNIVESDILFNTRFNWGDATNNSVVMDLQNIATHELGMS